MNRYVITYTENKQDFEVIWHADTVGQALEQMRLSYDAKDWQTVSNVLIYLVDKTPL